MSPMAIGMFVVSTWNKLMKALDAWNQVSRPYADGHRQENPDGEIAIEEATIGLWQQPLRSWRLLLSLIWAERIRQCFDEGADFIGDTDGRCGAALLPSWRRPPGGADRRSAMSHHFGLSVKHGT